MLSNALATLQILALLELSLVAHLHLKPSGTETLIFLTFAFLAVMCLTNFCAKGVLNPFPSLLLGMSRAARVTWLVRDKSGGRYFTSRDVIFDENIPSMLPAEVVSEILIVVPEPATASHLFRPAILPVVIVF